MAELRKLFEEYQGIPLIDRYAVEIVEKVGKIIGKEDFTIRKVCGMDFKEGKVNRKQIKEYGLKEENYRKKYCFISL